MAARTQRTTSADAYPWEERQRNGASIAFAIIGLVLFSLIGLFLVVAFSVNLYFEWGYVFEDFESTMPFLVVGFLITLCTLAIALIARWLSRQAALKPRTLVPANIIGLPLDVRFLDQYQRPRDRGEIWFGSATLRIVRKGQTRDIELATTQLTSLAGLATWMGLNEGLRVVPFGFRVSPQDGERLYRELCFHYPAQMQPYHALFANSPSVLRSPTNAV